MHPDKPQMWVIMATISAAVKFFMTVRNLRKNLIENIHDI